MFRAFMLTSIICVVIPDVQSAEPTSEQLGNWHQWRGPLANGTAPKADPPLTWDAKTNIKWQAELPGSGSATPIVWGDQVFVVAAIRTDRKAEPDQLPKIDLKYDKNTTAPDVYYQFVVLSFDRETGKQRWKLIAAERIPHEGHHDSHSYAGGSPTTDGKFLYVSFGSFGIYCYDLAGKLQWQRDLGRLRTRRGWGEAVTPVIHGNSLYLNWDQEADSYLICLDATNGKTKWQTERPEKTSWNTPLVVDYKGKTQVILNATNRVRSYDSESGKQIWECPGMTTNAIPSPVADDKFVYCMSGYTGSAAVAIPLDSMGEVKLDGAVRWRYNKGTPYVPSPLLVNNRLYFLQANTGILTILDVKTGKPLVAQERLANVTSFYASPVEAAGRVYLVDQAGTTLVLKTRDSVEVLATNRLDDPVDGSPALVGKNIFLRGHKYLYCIGK